MKEKLIDLDTAKLAKSKGFDVPTLAHYCETPVNDNIILCESLEDKQLSQNQFGFEINLIDHNNAHCLLKRFSAPTQSLLQRWLREKHNIVITISHWRNQPVDNEVWDKCYDFECYKIIKGTTPYKTYEEALEEGLKEALNLIPVYD